MIVKVLVWFYDRFGKEKNVASSEFMLLLHS